MEDESKSLSSESKVRINDAAALELLNILLKRGYFHHNTKPICSDTIHFRSNDECVHDQSPLYQIEDASLIKTANNTFLMIDVLRDRFLKLLEKSDRITISEASEALGVSNEMLLRRVVPWIIDNDTSGQKYIIITAPNGNVSEILLKISFEEQSKSLLNTLRENPATGRILVSTAALTVYNVPVDVALVQLEKFISSNIKDYSDVQILMTDSANKVLVVSEHIEIIRKRVINTLHDCDDQPIDVKTLAKDNGWEMNWILRLLKDGRFSDVNGEFHGDTYFPNRFIENQRALVTTTYLTNGYVTSHMCHKMFGISPTEMKEYVTHNQAISEEAYIILPNCVVSKDMIISPLLESVRDASESNSWLDLQLHIPIELLEYETSDTNHIVDTYILSEVPGLAYVEAGGGLYFSQGMIDRIASTIVTSVMKSAVSKASEVYHLYCGRDDVISTATESNVPSNSSKGYRKTSALDAGGNNNTAREDLNFPISSLVDAVVEAHPDLSNTDISSTILEETCKLAFYTDKLDTVWNNTIRKEVTQLEKNKGSSLTREVSNGGSLGLLYGFENIEAAFEDPGCFANCCYMIQAKAKFALYAIESTHNSITDEIREEVLLDFLSGCCRDFACRVTQYALHRNGSDEGLFSCGAEGQQSPCYYSPIDLAATSSAVIQFSCVTSQRDTLKVLKEELPPTVSLPLPTTWEMCGLNNRHLQSTAKSNVKANIDDFVSHVRENCFTCCGLPFANFDKKAEKRFLTLRRSQLISRLEKVEDMSDLLDLTIMLLYQNVKNYVVSGPLLRGPIFELLLQERKVSSLIASELRLIASMKEQGMQVDPPTIDRVQRLLSLKK